MIRREDLPVAAQLEKSFKRIEYIIERLQQRLCVEGGDQIGVSLFEDSGPEIPVLMVRTAAALDLVEAEACRLRTALEKLGVRFE